MDIDAHTAKNGKPRPAGTLSIVSTPIGNLGDVSFRAVEVLKSADIIACEDTRNMLRLANRFDIHAPLSSYHEHNRFEKAQVLVKELMSGKNIALVTDAGTPLISDPGEVLVRLSIEKGIPVTAVPGPSAAINALVLSGFDTGRFVFEGFLPPKKSAKRRRERIDALRDETRTVVLYEAPHRLRETLTELKNALGGERKIALAREMTKLHEEVTRCTLDEALAIEPRGEYVIVMEGRSAGEIRAERTASWKELPISEHIEMYTKKGCSENEAMKLAAKDRGITRRDVYNEVKKKAVPKGPRK